MKKNDGLKVLLILFILFSLCLGSYIVYDKLKVEDKKVENKKNNKTSSEQKNTEILDINDNIVTDLFNKFNDLNDFYVESYDYFYLSDKVTNEEVNDKIKFLISYNSLYGNTIEKMIDEDDDEAYINFRFSLDSLNEESQAIFGNRINIENIIKIFDNMDIDYDLNGLRKGDTYVDVTLKGIIFKYDKEAKTFSLGLSGLGGPGFDKYETKIISAKKYTDKIEIVNKVMFIASTACTDKKIVKIYKETTDKEFTLCNGEQIVNFDKEIDEIVNSDNDKIDIETYLDKLNSYKWTFIKDKNENYIFSKVEKI